MIVCVCNRVTDRQIRESADSGVTSLDELSKRLKVATCCGRCRDCAQRTLDDAMAKQWPAAAALSCA